MIGRAFVPYPNFGFINLISGNIYTNAASSSSIAYNTLVAIPPGGSAIHVLMNGTAASSFLFDPTANLSPTFAGAIGAGHAIVFYYRNYPAGLAAGTTITWTGSGTYTAGCLAYSAYYYGDVALTNWGYLSGSVGANIAYYAFQNKGLTTAADATNTQVYRNWRPSQVWVGITGMNTNAPLNGLGGSPSSGSWTVLINSGNATDPAKPLALAVVAGVTNVSTVNNLASLIQRQGVATTLVATYWRSVAP